MDEGRERFGDQLRIRVGHNIRAARIAAEMSQVALAEVLREEQTTISRWELGKVMPRPEALMGLARALNITVPDLFVPDEHDEREPNGAAA